MRSLYCSDEFLTSNQTISVVEKEERLGRESTSNLLAFVVQTFGIVIGYPCISQLVLQYSYVSLAITLLLDLQVCVN
jgi:hypothetical protein